MSDNIEIKLYSKEEAKKLLNDMKNERLVFIDDGIDEAIGRFRDLPDIIVDLNRKFGTKDLKIRNVIEPEDKPIIETFGMFLHKISSEDRKQIIDRLTKLQLDQVEVADYKLIDLEGIADYCKSRREER